MANFTTHIGVACGVSGMAASALVVATGGITPIEGLVLWLLGTVGGILPDIDADSSKPTRWLFNLLALSAVAVSLSLLHDLLPLGWLWVVMLIAYFAVRLVVMEMFCNLTTHRGVFHTLLAALFFGLLVTWLSVELLQLPAHLGWLAGLFITSGFLVHLLLDEIYAVDLNGMALKSSFGTAFKPVSFKNWPGSMALAVMIVLLIRELPDVGALLRFLTHLSWDFLFATPSWVFQALENA